VVRRSAQPAAGARPEACPPALAHEAAALTVSLQQIDGSLIGRAYRLVHGALEPDMRLIVTLTAALTVLVLVLPLHP